MSLSIATWNINSVRLRINNVKRYLRLRKPDVLCLQETKCPDEFFPHKAFEALGYTHRLVQGMKSYNGVAILSKVPFTARTSIIAAARRIAGTSRSRSIRRRSHPARQSLHPGGRRHPRPALNDKFAHKLDFYREMASGSPTASPGAGAARAAPRRRRRPQRGAAGARRVEPQAAPQDRVAHARRGRAVRRLQASLDWIDVPRRFVPDDQKLYSWWSYRNNDWRASNAAGGWTTSWRRRPCRRHQESIASTSTPRDWKQASDHRAR
jgi:exodeoxyribonuclease-3